MPRIRPRRGSRRGVEWSKPLLRVYTPEASVRPRERLSSRERFAHPAMVREASLVGIQTRADRSQGTGAGFHMCPCSGWVTPSTDLVDAITRSSGHRLASAFVVPSPGRRRYAPSPILYSHGRFLGPIFYKWMGRRDAITFSRRG